MYKKNKKFACFAPLASVRARREEDALKAEFGEQWQAYCKRVPMWIPRLSGVKGKTRLT
jgi:protein-S-isoprenylcysteine O-methyltransferase Ste14